MEQLAPALGFGVVTGSVLALAAVGISLQLSITNFFNFAYGDFMTLGAYVAYTANAAGANLFVAVVAGGIAVGLLGVLANIVIFRRFVRRRARIVTFLILTLGLSLIVQNVIIVIWGTGAYRYNVGLGTALHLGGVLLTPGDLVTVALAGVLLLALHVTLQYTTFGKALRATADNRDLARASGIDTERLVNWTWMISGVFAAVAGVGLVLQTGALHPSVGFDALFFVFAAIILGGIGKPYGAMLGALIVGVMTEIAGMYASAGYKAAFAFAIMVVVLLIRPQGLFASRGRTS
jgi:branched-subunit amino acid ABC-type transport system permease component